MTSEPDSTSGPGPDLNTARKPRIGIIGTGNMALALGRAFLAAGHFVAFGSRRPEDRKDFHAEVGTESRLYGVQAAIDAGEIVIIALPYATVAATARKFADSLRGKVVIDITNPFASQPNDGSSGAQVTATAIGDGARVVAAFKTNFAGTITEPVDSSGEPREVHYAGDDEEAKSAVAKLIRGIGFKPVDYGTLAEAVVIDHMVPLMIRLDRELHASSGKSSFRLAGP
ncbi:MAG: NAD(P)-binding domain-containing protein [Chloroflexi bacterium]|nr:NAD(P)-binding domain-containing protein [Chloroflexota bacterium]MCI0804638.1 NAD(P)-binding domain-containing protein [Chloroflexota bacterium]